ncbi:MAG: hypothetical protein MUC60_14040, partial [Oscillatoria sp. Prado101]|nr:hypothetical protein [Oscillatoria sp. Prado101]
PNTPLAHPASPDYHIKPSPANNPPTHPTDRRAQTSPPLYNRCNGFGTGETTFAPLWHPTDKPAQKHLTRSSTIQKSAGTWHN